MHETPIKISREQAVVRNTRLPDLSLRKLVDILDVAFEYYLTRQKETLTSSPYQQEIVDAWRAAVTQSPLSKVIRETFYKEYDFTDNSSLSDRQLADALQRFGDLGDTLCNKLNINLHHALVEKVEAAPIDIALREGFGCPDLEPGSHRIIWTFFNRYLLKEYLFEPATPTPQQLVREKEMELVIAMACLQQDLCLFAATATDSHDDRKLFLHNLVAVSKDRFDVEAAERFICAIDALKEGAASLDPKLLLEQVSTLLRNHFPAVTTDCVEREEYRLVVLGPKSEVRYVKLVRVENFYFDPDDSSLTINMDDWGHFPPDGHLIANASNRKSFVAGVRDLSVFDPSGAKVFWGDLPLEATFDMQGPFYVLSQADSCHQIPEWAIIDSTALRHEEYPRPAISGMSISPPRNPVRINTDYMRLVALGKIQNGAYRPNSE